MRTGMGCDRSGEGTGTVRGQEGDRAGTGGDTERDREGDTEGTHPLSRLCWEANGGISAAGKGILKRNFKRAARS